MLLSVFFMAASDSKLVSGVEYASLKFFGSVQKQVDQVFAYFNLYEENSQIRKENTRLAYENYQLQDALLENIRLRKLLQFKYNVTYQLIPAKVVGYSPQDLVTGLLLSTEEVHKVQLNAAVMTADGLVGKIVKVVDGYAVCQILFDPNNRVSARVQRNRQLGMIKWDGVNGYYLDHIPNTIAIYEGDVIYTSGLSNIYPPNLKIGIVNKVELNDHSLFQKLHVVPSVNLNHLEEVFIYNQTEIDEPRN